MIPAKSAINQKLAGWFKERAGLSYAAQQSVNRKLAKFAFEAGLVLCGYVGADGKFVETDKDAKGNADILWGFDSSSGKPVVVFAMSSDSPEAEFVPKQKALPLSPVFVLPIDRNEVIGAAFNSADVPEDLRDAYSPGFPPLFAPEPKAPANALQ